SYAADPATRATVITGLRALADFLEDHPEVPVSRYASGYLAYHPTGPDPAKRAEVARIATALDTTPTDLGGGHHVASRYVGPIEYRAVAIPAAEMAAHEALTSYAGAVSP